MLPQEDACARCGRSTPTEDLQVWTTRERLREFTRRTPQTLPAALRQPVTAQGDPPPEPAPPLPEARVRPAAVAYRWITRAHALCPDCHAVVQANGARFDDHDRRRAWVVVIATVGLCALIWAGFAPFAEHWMAAFWRNGAGGR